MTGNRNLGGHVPICRAAGAAGTKRSDTLPRPRFRGLRCAIALRTLFVSRTQRESTVFAAILLTEEACDVAGKELPAYNENIQDMDRKEVMDFEAC